MASRRDEIKMTEDEIGSYIESQKDLQVATIGKDGMPHLATMWFGVIDGRICFETYKKSQKIVNLRRDPRISVLLSSGDTYDQLKGVVIYGQAEVHEDADEVYPHALAVMKRNQPEIDPALLEQAAQHMARKRASVVVVPERIVSWDHTKLSSAS
jgi:PPOX class probable F420-dependent enzyme